MAITKDQGSLNMDKFNLSYTSDADESKWLDALKSFNDNNQDARTFIEKYGLKEKKQFTLNLFDILKGEVTGRERSSAALYQTMVALRISLREIDASEVEIVAGGMPLFFKFGNVGEDNKTSIHSDEIRDESMRCIVNCIARTKSLNSLLDVCTEQLEQRTKDGFEASVILGDLCRLMFTATMHWGQLDRGVKIPVTEDDHNRIRRLLPTYKKIMTQHCTTDQPMYQVKLALVSTLLNTPKSLYDEIVDHIPLSYLEEIFTIQSAFFDKPEAPGEMIPITMLLANIAENVPETRDPLKAFTFPSELIKETDEPLSVTIEPPKEAVTQGISSRLIPLMTSSDIGLKHFVSEFFYYICDEDANEVCRLTGYGNAAGLLVSKGLMSLGGQ
ncbi:hypothetical protein PPL_08749 [Heterostelium album PN500]|uniref:PH domain-containing protein n=1 Tax=Heterostelium pallidum (strain ATCC 26659 / Pp 5 / PN500) TaxID=670386 RepID=D3BJM1_HETP5|nr:hypothetical protein PPL_08749 [Heterostelium album PN500]EFA78101.1 hypothetical protein PPL_08749 [Heterostelium album PN500]|eukprot:XP_020430228.1 hypothetical protein PPL_08749 [Heterostelium album PN500]